MQTARTVSNRIRSVPTRRRSYIKVIVDSVMKQIGISFPYGFGSALRPDARLWQIVLQKSLSAER
jgi:hypothetical protein